MPLSVLAIAIGAALGAILRWLLGNALNLLFPTLPPGTLLANLIGAYLIGIAIVVFANHPGLGHEWRLFAVTGFLGGLTTFSSFSAEVTVLVQHGRWFWAGAAISAHVAGSVALTLLGCATAQYFARG